VFVSSTLPGTLEAELGPNRSPSARSNSHLSNTHRYQPITASWGVLQDNSIADRGGVADRRYAYCRHRSTRIPASRSGSLTITM
jgi:hypothetical protein